MRIDLDGDGSTILRPDQRAKLAATQADSKKTSKDKRKEKSAKRTLQWNTLALERKKATGVSFETIDSDSSDDIDDEITLKTDTVEIISKNRKDSGPLYRDDHAITEASMAGIK